MLCLPYHAGVQGSSTFMVQNTAPDRSQPVLLCAPAHWLNKSPSTIYDANSPYLASELYLLGRSFGMQLMLQAAAWERASVSCDRPADVHPARSHQAHPPARRVHQPQWHLQTESSGCLSALAVPFRLRH